MGADPEPRDLVVFKKSESAVSECHPDGVHGITSMNLLELQARMSGVVAEEPVCLPSSAPDFGRQVAVRRPEARRRAISQLVGVELSRSAGRSVGTRLGSEPAKRVLRGGELPSPMLIVAELVEQPLRDAVLFVGRQRRQLRESCVQSTSHT